MSDNTEVYRITVSIDRGAAHRQEIRDVRDVIMSRTLTDREIEKILDIAEARMEDFEAFPDD